MTHARPEARKKSDNSKSNHQASRDISKHNGRYTNEDSTHLNEEGKSDHRNNEGEGDYIRSPLARVSWTPNNHWEEREYTWSEYCEYSWDERDSEKTEIDRVHEKWVK
jgi:hypothetical protein